MTFCQRCRRAEMTRLQRLREDVQAVILGRSTHLVIDGLHAAFGAAYTGRTPYDRHRAEFERTGDSLELERMLRHVTPDLAGG